MASLITADEALNYAINSKNLVHRLKVTLDHKHPFDKHRGKYFYRLKKAMEDMDMDEIKASAESLEGTYSFILRANELILKIFKHHIPRQKYYLDKMPGDDFTKASYRLLERCQKTAEVFEKIIVPSSWKQHDLIHRFIQTYSLLDYAEFEKQFKEESRAGLELFEGITNDIHSVKQLVIMARKLSKKTMWKAEDFKDNHPICMGFFDIGLAFSYSILGIAAASKVIQHHSLLVKSFTILREHVFGGRLYSIDQAVYYPDYAETLFNTLKKVGSTA